MVKRLKIGQSAVKLLMWHYYKIRKCKKNDIVKNQYCINNNITLFRIDYRYQNNINEILNKVILEEDSETIRKFAINIANE